MCRRFVSKELRAAPPRRRRRRRPGRRIALSAGAAISRAGAVFTPAGRHSLRPPPASQPINIIAPGQIDSIAGCFTIQLIGTVAATAQFATCRRGDRWQQLVEATLTCRLGRRRHRHRRAAVTGGFTGGRLVYRGDGALRCRNGLVTYRGVTGRAAPKRRVPLASPADSGGESISRDTRSTRPAPGGLPSTASACRRRWSLVRER